MSHPVGHVKHHAETNQVAIRTAHEHPRMEWSVATATAGARHASTAEVEEWDDLFTPAPDDAPPPS